jgi:NADPH-dependent 2,4-dienoyl-CoA reductase/sulfur reductase-like enzyme
VQLVIVGGSDAGIAAALRAREIDPAVEVSVVLADAYPNFSIRGIPYHVSGDVPAGRRISPTAPPPTCAPPASSCAPTPGRSGSTPTGGC